MPLAVPAVAPSGLGDRASLDGVHPVVVPGNRALTAWLALGARSAVLTEGSITDFNLRGRSPSRASPWHLWWPAIPRAFPTARLLQVADPIATTFAVPFC